MAAEVKITENIREMLKGILEGCVLEIISREDTYGYEITRQLNALGFEETNQLVNMQQKKSELGPPKKLYSLNEAGREELKLFWRKWDFLESKINKLRENK